MNLFENITIKCKSDDVKANKESSISNKSLKEIFLQDAKEVVVTNAEIRIMASKLFGLFVEIKILCIVLRIFDHLIFPQIHNLQENQVFQFKEHIKAIFEIFSKFNNISTKDVKKDILSLAKKYFKCKIFIIPSKGYDKNYSPEDVLFTQISYILFPNIKLYKDPADSTAEELILAILLNCLANRSAFILISYSDKDFFSSIIMLIMSFFSTETKSFINRSTCDLLVIKEEFVDNDFDVKLENMFLECMAIYNICKNDPNIKVILKKILKLKIKEIDVEAIKVALELTLCCMDKITETELLVILIISYVLYKHKEC